MSIADVAKNFVPQEREKEIYDNWVDNGSFHAEVNKDNEKFSIVMPPPNITGQLHIGHALNLTLQDILIRFERLRGKEALWVPGTDHAAIATEVRIIDTLRKEGINKDDLGRDKFLERAWQWKDEYGGRIIEQSKRLGVSCDWRYNRFTMDEGLSEAVKKAFITLYKEGYIYRGNRIVNWCPCCETTISDAEVEYEEEAGHLWNFKYPIKDSDEYLIIATTRPETIPGDTAVAVHPSDERYTHLVGKTIILPVIGREIPIVADEYVEREFGTGCVKITPAHDPNDFEVGERHNLESINIMNENAVLNENAGKYAGMSREEARKAIVKDFEEAGCLVEIEDYTHSVGKCYRCKTAVEPRLSLQWFVAMKELAEPAIKAVEDDDIQFVPERFKKNYYHWMNNIRDWCISRQLWWGHPIPAYFCDECGEVTVSDGEPAEPCSCCGSKKFTQDPDTLDTWFSSALWPFSTLGWPEKTEELEYFFPTDVLVTGYDIITFWVSRMIFSSLKYTGKIPFKKVFINGIVRDGHGAKMSKSSGNGIDPLEIIDEYGTDALRFALVNSIATGSDTSLSMQRIEGGRNFVNKLWNSFRFILMNVEKMPEFEAYAAMSDDEKKTERLKHLKDLSREDIAIRGACARLIKEVADFLEQPEPGLALGKIYAFVWDEFCDRYIEISKPALRSEGPGKLAAMQTLIDVFDLILRLLHPYMPFVTHEIYQYLSPYLIEVPEEGIIKSAWPQAEDTGLEAAGYSPDEVASALETYTRINELIKSIRNIRADFKVDLSKKPDLYIKKADKVLLEEVTAAMHYMQPMARVNELQIVDDDFDPKGSVPVVFPEGSVFIPLGGMVDIDQEIKRIEAADKEIKNQIKGLEKKLSVKAFLEKAPAAVVQGEKDKLAKLEESLEKNKGILEMLKK